MNGVLTNDLLKLRAKLESIEKEFEEKLENVKEKEDKNKKIVDQAEEFIAAKDNTITLNIGGKKFLTKVSTLLKKQDSLFYQLLYSYISKNEEIPNEFFFDRSYTHFSTILDYLRTDMLNLKQFKNYDRAELEEELEYYGMINTSDKSKKIHFELAWEKYNLKGCSVDYNDDKLLVVNSNTCYTHFVTNRKFTEEDFCVEFESTVTQTDYYYYFGIINESYSITGNCMCCNPTNAYYIQCNGTIHINSTTFTTNELAWNGNNVTIGLKVSLKERTISFYIPEVYESEPYSIASGSSFTVVAGHCNSGSGTIKILDCYEWNK